MGKVGLSLIVLTDPTTSTCPGSLQMEADSNLLRRQHVQVLVQEADSNLFTYVSTEVIVTTRKS